jgi:hypothetical protein
MAFEDDIEYIIEKINCPEINPLESLVDIRPVGS